MRARLAAAVASARAWPKGAPVFDKAVPIGDATGATLLHEANRLAQQRAGLIRVGLSAILFATISWVADDAGLAEVARQVEAAKAFILILGATGIGLYWLAKRGIGLGVLPYVTVGVDAVLILGNLAYDHWALSAPSNMLFLFPVTWVTPIALATTAIYYRPRLQIFATAVYVVGLGALVVLAGEVAPGEARAAMMSRFGMLLGGQANTVRLVMFLCVGLVLILAARQGRLLLDRAVRESLMRANLMRYLPAELAPLLSAGGFDELRKGQRIPVALMFVDIRGSTALGASMEPVELARFITDFRRHVGAAAASHGGMIDKFIGDGALIVFGVPNPAATDASRALACAQELIGLVQGWNDGESVRAPVTLGIGVHCGEVFCGVLGEESRLEFTVLGDPVNVASRLEQATKTLGGPILASADVVEAAGAGLGWREVSREPLRGVSRAITILAPSLVAAQGVARPAARPA